jgi:hypothetical protein
MGMTNSDSKPTRIHNYIKEVFPWLHGHQMKGMAAIVEAILERQTGNQAQLASTQGNQEAATKRFSRLIHNDRIDPRKIADAFCLQALSQVPTHGKVRLSLDWTIENGHHLLVLSLQVGRRALPIFWRAYDENVLKGRMRRYEQAVIKRAFRLVFQCISPKRIRLTADRGFPEKGIFNLLESLKIRCIIRARGDVQVQLNGVWQALRSLRFRGAGRHRRLGRILYCKSSPHLLWMTMSRARNKKGKLETWYLLSNYDAGAEAAAAEYARRFSCEEGFRDTKWYLGFKKARVGEIKAWSRLFSFFVISLLILTNLGTFLLLRGTGGAKLLHKVASRRRSRCELSLITAMHRLLLKNWNLLNCLLSHTKFKLEYDLANVS